LVFIRRDATGWPASRPNDVRLLPLKRKFKRLPQFPTDRSPPDSLQREFPAMPGKLPGKTPHVNEICDYAGPTPLWLACRVQYSVPTFGALRAKRTKLWIDPFSPEAKRINQPVA
jgi:hypothetical protein